MMIDLSYEFEAEIWLWTAENGVSWHFLTLPLDAVEEIKFFAKTRSGFGSLKVHVQIGESQWKTSIFPYSEQNSFILPIKKEIRKNEKIGKGDLVKVQLRLSLDPF